MQRLDVPRASRRGIKRVSEHFAEVPRPSYNDAPDAITAYQIWSKCRRYARNPVSHFSRHRNARHAPTRGARQARLATTSHACTPGPPRRRTTKIWKAGDLMPVSSSETQVSRFSVRHHAPPDIEQLGGESRWASAWSSPRRRRTFAHRLRGRRHEIGPKTEVSSARGRNRGRH
jgi:hypothetical protein